jgi:hypothetical protein
MTSNLYKAQTGRHQIYRKQLKQKLNTRLKTYTSLRTTVFTVLENANILRNTRQIMTDP